MYAWIDFAVSALNSWICLKKLHLNLGVFFFPSLRLVLICPSTGLFDRLIKHSSFNTFSIWYISFSVYWLRNLENKALQYFVFLFYLILLGLSNLGNSRVFLASIRTIWINVSQFKLMCHHLHCLVRPKRKSLIPIWL